MYVGQLKNLCEFENPSTEMRNDAALDYGLRDMRLVKIENNAVTRDSVRAELAKLVAQGKTLDNGYPRTCYDMTSRTTATTSRRRSSIISARHSKMRATPRREILTQRDQQRGER